MRTAVMTLALAVVPAALPAQALTQAERAPLIASLEASHARLMDLSKNLTSEQWTYKPAPDRWSVAETAEHILVAEQSLMDVVTGPLLETRVDQASPPKAIPVDTIAKFMRDRSQKFQAPENVKPTSRWSTQADFQKAFDAKRKATIAFVAKSDADLKGHAFQNPAFGMIDGHRWLAFIVYHAERHMLQIDEVMAEAGFPKGGHPHKAHSGEHTH